MEGIVFEFDDEEIFILLDNFGDLLYDLRGGRAIAKGKSVGFLGASQIDGRDENPHGQQC